MEQLMSAPSCGVQGVSQHYYIFLWGKKNVINYAVEGINVNLDGNLLIVDCKMRIPSTNVDTHQTIS
ncbi:hypothetical protein ACH3XW_5000 [Acanthocheilonema viteae]